MPTNEEQNLAAKYDQLYRFDPFAAQVKPAQVTGWPTDRYQALVYLARPGGRLLEIGCGRGEVLLALASQFEEVVGTELSSERARHTQQQLGHLQNCRILNEPLERLEETAHPPFDCIVWGDVIEHVVDVLEAMRILARLSRPGTQLVTVTPNVAFLPQRLSLLLGRGPATTSACPNEGFYAKAEDTVLFDGGHLHYFTYRQVEILYRLAGFRVEKRMGFGTRLSRLRNVWPSLLSGVVCLSGIYEGRE
jgi:cyclopropane fatty-acyl-phospholipid synthase-like methyltransferase